MDEDPLSQILVYDQLTRHLRRLGKIDDINLYDTKALKIVEANIQNIKQYVSPIERCFFLMPYRHTFNHVVIE